MGELDSRIEMQRRVLALVNGHTSAAERLFGLSHKAIDRWVSANGLERGKPLVVMLMTIADRLSFLAAKSQDHLSQQRMLAVDEIEKVFGELARELSKGR